MANKSVYAFRVEIYVTKEVFVLWVENASVIMEGGVGSVNHFVIQGAEAKLIVARSWHLGMKGVSAHMEENIQIVINVTLSVQNINSVQLYMAIQYVCAKIYQQIVIM